MSHAEAQAAIEALFEHRLPARRRAALREHLRRCEACQTTYDRAVRVLRGAKADEISAEELWLFEPDCPRPRFSRKWIPAFAGTLAAAAAGIVLLVVRPGEFTPRAGEKSPERPGLRVLCVRGEGAERRITEANPGACGDGDRLLFVAVPRGRGYLAVVLSSGEAREVVVAGVSGALPDAVEAPLAVAAGWRPGLRVMAFFGPAPVDESTALACAAGSCPSGYDIVSRDLDAPARGGR